MNKPLEDFTEPELDALMQTLARKVEQVCTSMGVHGRAQFAVLVFNDPARSNYVSSCSRETMVDALREFIDRAADVPRPPDQQARPAIAELKRLGYVFDQQTLGWRRP